MLLSPKGSSRNYCVETLGLATIAVCLDSNEINTTKLGDSPTNWPDKAEIYTQNFRSTEIPFELGTN